MSSDGNRRPLVAAGGREHWTGEEGRRTDPVESGRGKITAFYIETLVLVAIFLMVVVVLGQIFSLSVGMSDGAEELTCAVRLAENAAEAVATSKSAEDLAGLLNENENAGIREDGCVYAAYDRSMNPLPDGVVQVEATWEPQEDGCVESVITVRRKEDPEPIYTLTTAVYTHGR